VGRYLQLSICLSPHALGSKFAGRHKFLHLFSSGSRLCKCLGVCASVQADDRKFKDELGRVIEMDIWEAAKAKAAERLKGTKRQLTELDSEARVRQELLANLQSQVSPVTLLLLPTALLYMNLKLLKLSTWK
jgi:hypothetical protein